jgi:hypothetical protein
MITIGYSTRNSNPEFQEYLKKSCGHPKTEVIEKVTNGEKNLSQVYNEIISESTNDIIVLCHDDIYFDTKNWGQKLEKLFDKNNEFSIIGVAGTTSLPKSGMWWEDKSKMWGIVNHENNGKKWESRYSDSLNNEIKEVVIVDGLFIAFNKQKIKENFDESINGFHFYDVNFCFNNHLNGSKIGVTTLIRITHKSIGMTNDVWENNRKEFSKKNESKLPVNIKYSSNDNIKVYMVFNNPNEINNIVKSNDLLFNKNEISLITETINSSTNLFLKQNKIKYFSFNNFPGYKIGDGVTKMNTPNGVQVMELGKYYKINEEKIDLLVFDSVDSYNKTNFLYKNVKKILIQFLPEKLPSNILHDENTQIFSYDEFNKLTNDENHFYNFLNTKNTLNLPKIKILSGFSEKGGSTTSFINLTNFFNNNGINCTFYGPHNWHLDKCKSDLISNFKFEEDDNIIYHYLKIPNRPTVKNIVLSSHEKWWFEVKNEDTFCDKVIFLHEKHKEYHKNYTGPFEIIPNLKEDLKSSTKNNLDNIAGIIGTIEPRKQTHISIQRALNDGCEKILLFGHIGDDKYFKENIESYLNNPNIILIGHSTDKQKMYDSIGRVYHSSIGEVACLVKDECYLTNTKFFGNQETDNEVSNLDNLEILNLWKKVFNL